MMKIITTISGRKLMAATSCPLHGDTHAEHEAPAAEIGMASFSRSIRMAILAEHGSCYVAGQPGHTGGNSTQGKGNNYVPPNVTIKGRKTSPA